jgi:hypothetical protein
MQQLMWLQPLEKGRAENRHQDTMDYFPRIIIIGHKGGKMNCPKHIKETSGPDALKKIKEREDLEELTQLLAGPEEDYDS